MNENFLKNLPPRFIENILDLHKSAGEKWLADLPQIINKICKKWRLEIGTVFPNLSFNFVAECADEKDEKFVLKIGVPEKDSAILFERRALEAFGGKAAVEILRFDEKSYAMLLERAVEGKTLSEICGEDYGKAIEIAVEVMKELPRNPPNKKEFINLDKWTNALNRAAKIGFAPQKVSRAQRFFAEFSEPFENKILLHGDIHFDNILSARRQPFLVIDPKGVIGEIGYEIAVFLNDLAGWTEHLPKQKEVLDKAVEKFSLGFSVNSKDLRKWAFAFSVLSAWWMMEDFGKNYEKTLALTDIWDV